MYPYHYFHPIPSRSGGRDARSTVGGPATSATLFLSRQSSGAMSKSRWTSWTPDPNKPTVSVDVKQHFNQPLTNVSEAGATILLQKADSCLFCESTGQPGCPLHTPLLLHEEPIR